MEAPLPLRAKSALIVTLEKTWLSTWHLLCRRIILADRLTTQLGEWA